MTRHRHRKHKTSKPPQAEIPPALHPNREGDLEIEKDPAIEWGERIQTGKIIARGGKTKGRVPGASESAPENRPSVTR